MLRVRVATAADKAAWLVLWKGYCDFYKSQVPDAVTELTWKRLLGGEAGMGCLLAEQATGHAAGFLTYVAHPGTWSMKPLCYLEDIFVAPHLRRQGVARSLIEALIAVGRARGWRRIYWQTKPDNLDAQAFYDKIAVRTDWVRYDLDL